MPTPPEPRLPGRYAATSDADTVHIWCQDHPEAPLLSLPGVVGDHPEIDEAMRDHDWQFHEEDRVV